MERELHSVEREVVNPAHRVLCPTVNHLHKVLREKDGERASLLREKNINKTVMGFTSPFGGDCLCAGPMAVVDR